MSPRSTRLAGIGNISRDTAIYPHDRRTTLGGAALHIAIAATLGGLPSTPVSVIGTDLDHIRVDRRFGDIDWSATATLAGRSTTFTLTYDAQGEIVQIDADYGVATSLTDHALAHIHARLHDTYHVCCRRPLDIAAVLHAYSRSGRRFSVDFMISSAQRSIAAAAPLIHQAEPVFITASEYGLLITAVPMETLPTVIVTDGPRPVRLFHHGQLAADATPPSAKVVEVTGAGDTFTGTFLAARAARAAGLSDQDSLRQATAAATRHIATPGLAIETS